jgi:hypothetical protein
MLIARAEPFGKRLAAALLFGALAAATAAPWYMPAYVYTGNPVFPLLNGIFKSPRYEPVNALMDSRSFGVGTRLNAVIELPSRLTFNPRFGTRPGTLGVLALFCAPFGLLLLFTTRNTEARLIAFVGGVYMVFWTATFQNARYYMVVFPVVAVLGVAGVLMLHHTALTERVTRMAALVLLVAQAALLSLHYAALPERFPVKVALGLETREAFLGRVLPGYNAAQQVNREILPGQRVLGVETEHVRLYLKPPIDVPTETLLDHPLRTVTGSDPEIARGLESIGYAYLLVTRDAMRYPKPWLPFSRPEFLNRFATLESDDGRVALYRLKPQR